MLNWSQARVFIAEFEFRDDCCSFRREPSCRNSSNSAESAADIQRRGLGTGMLGGVILRGIVVRFSFDLNSITKVELR